MKDLFLTEGCIQGMRPFKIWSIINTMKDEFDSQKGYCRKLGHHLEFSYCRQVRDGLPCSLVLDCWFEKFGVQEFINREYSEEERKIIFSPPKPKLAGILDIVRRVKEQKKGE